MVKKGRESALPLELRVGEISRGCMGGVVVVMVEVKVLEVMVLEVMVVAVVILRHRKHFLQVHGSIISPK